MHTFSSESQVKSSLQAHPKDTGVHDQTAPNSDRTVSVQLREQPAPAKLPAGEGRDCGRSPFSHLGKDFWSSSGLSYIPSALPIPGLISPNTHCRAELEAQRNADLPLLCAPPARANKERRKEELPWWSLLSFPSSCSPRLTPAGRDCESYAGLQIPAALNPGADGSDLAKGAAGAACVRGSLAPRWLFIWSFWLPFAFLLSLQILAVSLCGNDIIAIKLETVQVLCL